LAAIPALASTQKFSVDGVPVVLKTNAGTPVVSAKFYLKGGLPYYKPENAGAELLLFQTAVKGSKKFPKEKLQEAMARTGTQIGPLALHDFTVMSLTCLRRDLAEAWGMFADVISAPALDEEEVRLARERQLNNIRQMKDDPDSYLRQLADELFYANHPYAVQPTGTEESVGRLDAGTLKAYLGSHVNKARALVVIVGDVDRSTAEKLVHEGFGQLPEGAYDEPQAGQQTGGPDAQTRIEERKLPTNYIRGYYDAPSLADADYAAMKVATNILNDRLFEEVRTKRNLTYAVSANISTRRDNYGLLYVTAVEPDTTLRVMLHEVKRIQTEPISDKELRDQIKVIVTDYLITQQTNASQAEAFGQYELLGGGWANADLAVERMRKVSPEDIRKVAQNYIHNVDFVMLGDPQKWKDPLASDQPADKAVELH
jgi:zinc protease